jgi:hypothetical protein
MTVNWGGYYPYIPIIARPMHEVTRKEARDEFKKLMAEKGRRIEYLRELVKLNGIELRSTDEGLQELNDWFVREVEPRPDKSGRLLSIWYAVGNDLALYVGDIMIERSPGLKWVMFDKGKRSIYYQRHVIMGYSKVSDPQFAVDVDRLISTYGHCLIDGDDVDSDEFVGMVYGSQKYA